MEETFIIACEWTCLIEEQFFIIPARELYDTLELIDPFRGIVLSQ
jgi:hypothetical protein